MLEATTTKAPSTAVRDRLARTRAAGLALEAPLARFCDEARDVLRAFDREMELSADDCMVEGMSEPLDEVHSLISRMHDSCGALFREAFAGAVS